MDREWNIGEFVRCAIRPALPAGVTAVAMGRERADGGVFDTEASAWYIEDNWNITPYFLLNLGVRMDNLDYKTATGSSFIELDELREVIGRPPREPRPATIEEAVVEAK